MPRRWKRGSTAMGASEAAGTAPLGLSMRTSLNRMCPTMRPAVSATSEAMDAAARAQPVDQPSLRVAAEGQAVDVANGVQVARILVADQKAGRVPGGTHLFLAVTAFLMSLAALATSASLSKPTTAA